MPRISVVIPSYNHGRFLRACIEGIRKQTFQDWEILLIDDGSKDDSVELARQIAESEPRLRIFVNEQNLGTYGTEQKGVEMSDSEFVAILNSDDLWTPEKLAKQVQALDENKEAALCYVLGWKIDDNDKVDETDDVHFDWPTAERQELLPYLLYENRVLASSVLFRRQGLKFDTSCRYSGDWVALLNRSFEKPVACVPERLSYWRMHDNNTFTISPRQVLEEIRVREAIDRDHPRWHLARLAKNQVDAGLAKNAMNLCALYVLGGDIHKARKAIKAAIRLHPNKQVAWKRAAATLLPLEKVRARLWPNLDSKLSSEDLKAVKEGLTQIKPLRW